ncbi:hypothetical protein SAMN04488075_2889 [Paracoccus alkenifer]|uniref:Uncharacterized protein n=1 Tax=Paracoccus alkenifer TaxID=65735 RepID=A0A1H6NI79_9RHOB|nr:hypothetical protein SAMN04488075_2889 [Paracoccus alkenifer]
MPTSTTADAGLLKAARQGQLRPVFQLSRRSSSGGPSWNHSFARPEAADLRQASCRVPEMKDFTTLAMSRDVQRLPWSEQRRSARLSVAMVALRSRRRPNRRDQHLGGCRGASDRVPLSGRQPYILGVRRCWRFGLVPQSCRAAVTERRDRARAVQEAIYWSMSAAEREAKHQQQGEEHPDSLVQSVAALSGQRDSCNGTARLPFGQITCGCVGTRSPWLGWLPRCRPMAARRRSGRGCWCWISFARVVSDVYERTA